MYKRQPDANTDYDGALCIPYVYGCMDYSAYNYEPFANTDDGSCYYEPGCTNVDALNYNSDADYDDGSCIAIVEGCTNPVMWNYDSAANTDDGPGIVDTGIALFMQASTSL